MSGGVRQTVAASIAEARIDSLTSLACAQLAVAGVASGTKTRRGIIETWRVTDGRTSKTIAVQINYFPVIYSSGDLHLSHGRGQGILLANGDVRLNGNFQWVRPDHRARRHREGQRHVRHVGQHLLPRRHGERQQLDHRQLVVQVVEVRRGVRAPRVGDPDAHT